MARVSVDKEVLVATADEAGHAEALSPRLLRIEDIAERLNVSRSFAWKLVSFGAIRSLRIGRSVRVRPSDLEAYIAAASRDE